eukprot:COSAG02_NODE_4828_length_4932_cov_37.882888_1_plen_70_part_00
MRKCHVLTTRLPLTVLVSKFRDVDQLECQYLEITEKSSEIEPSACPPWRVYACVCVCVCGGGGGGGGGV